MSHLLTFFTSIWAAVVAAGCTERIVMVVAATLFLVLFLAHEVNKRRSHDPA